MGMEAEPVSNAAPMRAAAVVPVQTAMTTGEKLTQDEMEIAAHALHSLASHRSGGPFGNGRLPGEQAQETEERQLKALVMLEAKDGAIVAATPVASDTVSVSVATRAAPHL